MPISLSHDIRLRVLWLYARRINTTCARGVRKKEGKKKYLGGVCRDDVWLKGERRSHAHPLHLL